MMDKYYIGDGVKMPLTIACNGFNQDTDSWTATFVTVWGKRYVCDKTKNTAVGENGQWYLLVNTDELGCGQCDLYVDIDIPDGDFGGARHETHFFEKVFNIEKRTI